MARTTELSVLAAAGFLPCMFAFVMLADVRTRYSVVISAVISAFGFLATRKAIPIVKEYTLRSNLFGMDINKRGAPSLCTEYAGIAQQSDADLCSFGNQSEVSGLLQCAKCSVCLLKGIMGFQAPPWARRRCPSPWGSRREWCFWSASCSSSSSIRMTRRRCYTGCRAAARAWR